jgi:hypothetical protein
MENVRTKIKLYNRATPLEKNMMKINKLSEDVENLKMKSQKVVAPTVTSRFELKKELTAIDEILEEENPK